MSPDEREFGELLGEMKGVRQQISDMQARNSEEHGRVMERLQKVEDKLDRRVDWKWMNEQDLPDRVDRLEAKRDERRGQAALVKIAEGIALFAIALIGLLATKGVIW